MQIACIAETRAARPEVASPASRYAHIVADALATTGRALARTDRMVLDAAAGLSDIAPQRLTGAIAQADEALALLAAAERYRVRNAAGLVTAEVIGLVRRASNDIELGSRALRRAAALMTDPDIDRDATLHRGALDVLSIAHSELHSAQRGLRSAGTVLPDHASIAVQHAGLSSSTLVA